MPVKKNRKNQQEKGDRATCTGPEITVFATWRCKKAQEKKHESPTNGMGGSNQWWGLQEVKWGITFCLLLWVTCVTLFWFSPISSLLQIQPSLGPTLVAPLLALTGSLWAPLQVYIWTKFSTSNSVSLLDLLFEPEDGGSTFHWNIGELLLD